MTKFKPIPYRIRIGITGHRNISDPASVEIAIRKAIETELVGLFSDKSRKQVAEVRRTGTTPIVYSIVSPLAEGADRAAARALLEIPGTRLNAVLPLVVEDYLEDFTTAESKDEFRSLLGRCQRPVFLRRVPISREADSEQQARTLRHTAYENVGQYVVSHCDVLVSVWDGQPARGRGGTAEVVEYAVAQGRPILKVWDGIFEVYHRGNGLDVSALVGVDRFNRAPFSDADSAGYFQSLEREYFELPKSAGTVTAESKKLVKTELFPYYAQASRIAKARQREYYGTGVVTYWLSSAAVAAVVLVILGLLPTPVGFGLEFVFLALIWFMIHRTHRRQSRQVWMENRFLAERIRSGVFLAICKVDASPIEVLPFMGQAHAVNDWMVRVFDEIWGSLPPLRGCSEGQCGPLTEYIREVWIGGQLSYHEKNYREKGRVRARLEAVGKWLLPMTLLAAGLHIFMDVAPEYLGAFHGVEGLLTFAAIVFPSLAASSAGMLVYREHARSEKRSESMIPHLKHLDRRFASATNPDHMEMLLQQMDEIMLRETQDWLMLMRFAEFRH